MSWRRISLADAGQHLFHRSTGCNCPRRRFLSSSGQEQYEVIVIGGGHAGCESAAAAARMGARTLLITHSKEKVGEMSCNPSFGGIGKGHLMREIDAMDGVCARLCDQTGVHFHVLNRSHGPAVCGPRALIDRKLYKKAMQKEMFHNTPNLEVLEAAVDDLLLEEATCPSGGGESTHRVKGCVANGEPIRSPTVVITTGTFLNGQLVWGSQRVPGGRIGEAATTELAKTFRRLGFRTGRLSTGTPPRLLARSVDFSRFEVQPTDEDPVPFSYMNSKVGIPREQHLCSYLGYTNERVAQIVRENVDEGHSLVSALQEGIKGPRYCPSLEAKCLRFGHLNHRVFLEPEGLDSELIYPQGCALGFSAEVQLKIMRAIDGLERVEITQPGYSVRYDFVHPQQLWPTLETKRVQGLFLAGQINGTTGYEEAAAQGLLAGTNATVRAQSSAHNAKYEPLVLDRTLAYIGVMIDDLTSMGVTEPYRVFTSRAENRIFMRPDNADLRLTEIAMKKGLVSDERWNRFETMRTRLERLSERLGSLNYSSAQWNKKISGLNSPGKSGTAYSGRRLLLKHPELRIEKLAEAWPDLFAEFGGDRNLEERVRNAERYAPVEGQMREQLETIRRGMDAKLPEELDYLSMQQLKPELRERLHERRPTNLGAAAKIPGINDTALLYLLHYAKRKVERKPVMTESIALY